jgi:hypothetical protein
VQSLILLVIDDCCVTKQAAECQTRQQQKERVCMADEKVTISELIRLRRSTEPREFALAAFYPQTHSGTAAHLKRTEGSISMVPEQPLRSRLRHNPDRPESVAKPWKKPWDK